MVVDRRHIRTITVGPIQLVFEYGRDLEDEGPIVTVMGRVGEHETPLLEFYCFRNDPRYVYAPGKRDEVHHARDEGIEDMVEWTRHRLLRSLPDMLRRAGFGEIADQVDVDELSRRLGSVELLVEAEGSAERE